MGADWNWLAVEVAEDGDREAVVEAITEDRETDRVRMTYDTDHDGMLVFDGPASFVNVEERLSSVTDHVRRAVAAQHHDTAGSSSGFYYEVRDSELVTVETLTGERLGEPALFDYFARRYDVHGAR